MKRCPECGREYDNTMALCLDDGAELLYGPASEKVFEWLEKDFRDRSSSLLELRMEVPFAGLRNDSRFKDLLKRIGLPD